MLAHAARLAERSRFLTGASRRRGHDVGPAAGEGGHGDGDRRVVSDNAVQRARRRPKPARTGVDVMRGKCSSIVAAGAAGACGPADGVIFPDSYLPASAVPDESHPLVEPNKAGRSPTF